MVSSARTANSARSNRQITRFLPRFLDETTQLNRDPSVAGGRVSVGIRLDEARRALDARFTSETRVEP